MVVVVVAAAAIAVAICFIQHAEYQSSTEYSVYIHVLIEWQDIF